MPEQLETIPESHLPGSNDLIETDHSNPPVTPTSAPGDSDPQTKEPADPASLESQDKEKKSDGVTSPKKKATTFKMPGLKVLCKFPDFKAIAASRAPRKPLYGNCLVPRLQQTRRDQICRMLNEPNRLLRANRKSMKIYEPGVLIWDSFMPGSKITMNDISAQNVAVTLLSVHDQPVIQISQPLFSRMYFNPNMWQIRTYLRDDEIQKIANGTNCFNPKTLMQSETNVIVAAAVNRDLIISLSDPFPALLRVLGSAAPHYFYCDEGLWLPLAPKLDSDGNPAYDAPEELELGNVVEDVRWKGNILRKIRGQKPSSLQTAPATTFDNTELQKSKERPPPYPQEPPPTSTSHSRNEGAGSTPFTEPGRAPSPIRGTEILEPREDPPPYQSPPPSTIVPNSTEATPKEASSAGEEYTATPSTKLETSQSSLQKPRSEPPSPSKLPEETAGAPPGQADPGRLAANHQSQSEATQMEEAQGYTNGMDDGNYEGSQKELKEETKYDPEGKDPGSEQEELFEDTSQCDTSEGSDIDGPDHRCS